MFLLPEARERLAIQQAALLRALADRAAPPDGFDPTRLRATADALARKRARGVARTWPALAGALSDRLGPLFAAYAAATRPPRHGGPLADGRAFARALADWGELPEAAHVEVMAVDLRHAPRPDGLAPRRLPSLAVALLRRPHRLVLAARLPRLGERWLAIRLGR